MLSTINAPVLASSLNGLTCSQEGEVQYEPGRLDSTMVSRDFEDENRVKLFFGESQVSYFENEKLVTPDLKEISKNVFKLKTTNGGSFFSSSAVFIFHPSLEFLSFHESAAFHIFLDCEFSKNGR